MQIQKEHIPHLKKIAAFIPSAPILHAVSMARFFKQGDNTHCSVSNISTTVTYKQLPASACEPFYISKKDLTAIVKNPLTKDVSLLCGNENISVQMGEAHLTLKSNSELEKQYPKLLDVPVKVPFPAKVIADIKEAYNFVSNDDLRPAMTGVYMHDVNGRLMIAGTDAHRLYYKDSVPTPPEMKGIRIILEAETVRLLTTLFNDEPVSIGWSESFGHVSFDSERFNVTSRCIEAKYPDYMSVVNYHAATSEITLNKHLLITVLTALIPFLNKSTMQVKFSLDKTKDVLKMSGGDLDFESSVSYAFPVISTGDAEEMTWGMNASMLLKILKTIGKGNDIVTVKYSHPTKAFYIDKEVLLMPLMLNE